MPALYFFLGILALTGLGILTCGVIAYRSLILYRRKSLEEIRTACDNAGNVPPAYFEFPWIRQDIETPDGYQVAAFSLPGTDPRHTIVFHHGLGWNRFAVYRYMEPFRQKGWNLVCFDARGHGDSGGGNPTFGVLEKRDLGLVVDWSRRSFPATGCLVLFGESLGAATVLQYAPLDSDIGAIIADCPYSDAETVLDHNLRAYRMPHLLRRATIGIVNLLTRVRDGFVLSDANAERAIMAADTPVLLIHGTEDGSVPVEMSIRLYDARREKARTELALFPGATHAHSYDADTARYFAIIFDFLSRVELEARNSRPIVERS